jgi:protein-S-isoprenylcysteine O-methyltransferase Ste14
MTPGALLALAVASVTLAIFVVAAGYGFRQVGRAPAGLNLVKLTGPLSCGLMIWSLAVARVGLAWSVAGAALILLSLALFLWALVTNRRRPLSRIYCSDPPEHLQVAGPYRLVRHPCYGAYLLAFLGGLVASHHPAALAVLVGNAALYAHAARFEERKFAAGPLAADYAAYRVRTGAFLPWPW